MSASQNFMLNSYSYQAKTRRLDFPSVIKDNKCKCLKEDFDDLLIRLNLKSVNVETLVSSYYVWRKELADSSISAFAKHDSGKIVATKITPHRLSQIYKVAESINFMRSLYLKSEDSLEDSIDIVDGVLSIFLYEISVINDTLVTKATTSQSNKVELPSDQQLIRSYC